MAEAYYEPTPATDGATMNPVPGAVFQVYEIADTTFTTPLSLRVGSGNPTTTVTASDTLATLPGVYVTSPNYEHIWKSGTFEWRRDSIDGAKKAIEDAKIAASNSASASDASALAAANSAQAATDAAALVDAPADQIMADTAANPATAFAGQLSATIAEEVPVAGATHFAPKTGETVSASSVYVQRYPKAKASAISRAHTGLGDRNTTPFDVLVLGDSVTEGQGATARSFRYVDRFRDLLRSQFPTPGVAGGSNYMTAAPLASSFPKNPPSSTLTVVSSMGLGRRAVQLTSTTSTSSLVFTVVATSVKLAYLLGSLATFTYQIDGGTPVVVDVAGTRTPAKTLEITGLGGTAHTITVKWNSGGVIHFDALYVYNGDETRGIRVWEGGHYGYKTSDFTNPSFTADWMAHITNIQPQLVVIALGTNDAITDSVATYKANMQTLISNVRTKITTPPSIVLVGQPERTDNLVAPWSGYVAALKEIAAADAAVDVLDLTAIMPKVSGAPSGWFADGVHPANKGQAEEARALVEFITP